MKKTVSLILALLLVFSLAACGGGSGQNADDDATKKKSGSATSEPESQTEAAQPAQAGPADVQTELSGYTLSVQPMDHERESEPTFNGLHEGVPLEYGTDDVRLNVAVSDSQSGDKVFDIFVRDAYPSSFVQEGNPITGKLRARLGDQWMFSLRGNLEEDEDFYIYNVADNKLIPLDSSALVRFYGDRFLLHAAVYSEEALSAAYLYDWSGNIVTGYIEVADLTESGGYLYMLRFNEPIELHRVPVTVLADHNADPTSQKVCDLGSYYGMFVENDSIVFQPLAGGYPVTCKLADAADTVKSLLETEAPVAEGDIVESCKAFSVSLPASWKDRYLCEKDDDCLRFRYKTSPSDTEGIYLFQILVSDGPDSLEEPGFGGAGIDYEVCEIIKNGRTQYIMVSEPDEYEGVPGEKYDDYMELLDITTDIETRLQGENGYTIRLFDYNDLIGDYVGTTDYGAEYILSITFCRRNILVCDLYFSCDDMQETLDDVLIRMFSNGGVLNWSRLVDEATDDWDFGSGVFLQEEEGFSLMLSAEGDSWTTTDGYLSMEYVVD